MQYMIGNRTAQRIVPIDEQHRRQWPTEANVHVIASALNRAEHAVCRAAFGELPEGKARRVFTMLEPPAQASIIEAVMTKPGHDSRGIWSPMTVADSWQI